MAGSSTNIDAVVQSQASKEITINAFFDAASQAATYGRRASTCSGLTWGYYGGNVVRADGTRVEIANGTLTLTASATNYVVAAKASGAVSKSTSTTNWNDTTNYWRLYSIVAGSATVTSYSDYRCIAEFSGGSKYQPLDDTLTALAAVVVAANKLIYATDVDTFSTCDLTAAARALLDDADAAAQRATLGLGDSATKNTGTSAGTVAAGDHNHSGVYEPADATILKDADIGVTVQAEDATLTALAGVTTAADKLIYATDVDTFSTCDFTAAGRSVVGAADAAAQRTALGLESMATQAASAVAVTGGTVSGLSSLGATLSGSGAVGIGGITSAVSALSITAENTNAIAQGLYVAGTLKPSGTVQCIGLNLSAVVEPAGASLGNIFGQFYGLSLNGIAPTGWQQCYARANFGASASGTVTAYYSYLGASPNVNASSTAKITSHYQFYGNNDIGAVTTTTSAAFASNQSNLANTITHVERTSDVATVTTSSANYYAIGQTVTVTAVTDTSFNGAVVVTAKPAADKISYANVGTDKSSTADTGTTTVAGRYCCYMSGNAPSYWAGTIASLGSYNATTASAANVYIDAAGLLQRSTSSRKYKKNIETLEASYADAVIFGARPVWYRSTCENDNAGWGWYGLIAEELADIDKRLVHWAHPHKTVKETTRHPEEQNVIGVSPILGADGNPVPMIETKPAWDEEIEMLVPDTDAPLQAEGVQYDRLTVLLIDVVQRQQKTIEALEKRMKKLEGKK